MSGGVVQPVKSCQVHTQLSQARAGGDDGTMINLEMS